MITWFWPVKITSALYLVVSFCPSALSDSSRTIDNSLIGDPTTTTTTTTDSSTSTTHASRNTNTRYTSLLSSDASIFEHVDWGNATTQRYTKAKPPNTRIYFGYGECPQRSPIDYEVHIRTGESIADILLAYRSLFRLQCNPQSMATFIRLFEKGYAILDADHSITFSIHHKVFIKLPLTYLELEDLQDLLELSAMSQTYVSWYKYPVASIDPTGEPITDACFNLVVGYLHALDLIKQTAKKYLSLVMYTLGLKLKPTLREMRDKLRGLHGSSTVTLYRRRLATNTLAVSMGLMEFMLKHANNVLKGHFGCAHSTFREFYVPKQENYVRLARKLGTMELELQKKS